MKISIITPNLNCGKYLREMLESVFHQGYDCVEHIVLDGCSTDESLDVLREWEKKVNRQRSEVGDQQSASGSEESDPGREVRDQRSAVNDQAAEDVGDGSSVSVDGRYSFRWISETDKGQTDAINKGFRMATGDIRTWLNADEFYYSGTLDAVSKVFEADPDLSLLYGEAMFTRIDGSPIRARHVHRPDQNVFLYYGCYMASVATFYNGKLFDDGIYLDDDYKVTMDFEFYARLWSLGKKIEFLPRVLGAFRLTGDNVSIRLAERKMEERIRVQRLYGLSGLGGRPLPLFALQVLAKIYQVKSGLMRFRRQLGRISEGELQ